MFIQDSTSGTVEMPTFSIALLGEMPGGESFPPAADPPDQLVNVFSTSAVGTPFGFRFDVDPPSDEGRSEQVIRMAYRGAAGELLGYVELSEGPAYGRQILDSVTRGWATAGVVAVLLAVLAGWVASRRITTPLLALARVTSQMAAGDLSARADRARQDEFGQLAGAFNEMAARVQATVVTLRRFVADAAHAVHTPLTALRTNLELIDGEPSDARRADFIARAQTQLQRLETLTNSLLDLSSLETAAAPAPASPVDLSALVRDASELYASQAEQAGLDYSLDLPPEPLMVLGHAVQLRQALGNLLDNAIKFTPQDGAIHVRLRRDAGQAVLSVQDTGIGIPDADLPQLFNRFHRGRNAAPFPGSGLGLAIVQAIATTHAGQVEAENLSPGARFTLRLPATLPAAGAPGTDRNPAPPGP